MLLLPLDYVDESKGENSFTLMNLAAAMASGRLIEYTDS
jgi:hypothetical protein